VPENEGNEAQPAPAPKPAAKKLTDGERSFNAAMKELLAAKLTCTADLLQKLAVKLAESGHPLG
jgi:hypothetical protein